MTADTSIFMCRDLDLDTTEYRQEILPCIAENIVNSAIGSSIRQCYTGLIVNGVIQMHKSSALNFSPIDKAIFNISVQMY